ncbi:MAG TPA: DUF1127 domain-containing protein [Acetobacteraceae bacterium]|nr:DUF1127 domain-containing protein [Acetobacteraceae bacterium]
MLLLSPTRNFYPSLKEQVMRNGFTLTPTLAFARAFTPRLPPVAATLRLWRQRARERAELAGMDPGERADLPFGREVNLDAEARKPFWRP